MAPLWKRVDDRPMRRKETAGRLVFYLHAQDGAPITWSATEALMIADPQLHPAPGSDPGGSTSSFSSLDQKVIREPHTGPLTNEFLPVDQ